MAGPAGELVRQVASIDAALQGGFTITLDEVSPMVFQALRALWAERERYEREKPRG